MSAGQCWASVFLASAGFGRSPRACQFSATPPNRHNRFRHACTDFSHDPRAILWHLLIMSKYSAAQTKAALRFLPDWTKKGGAITRTFQFRDFSGAIEFVNAIARLAEKAWHHPDIDIRYSKVTLTLTTHSEGGLTEKDFDLATKIDQL